MKLRLSMVEAFRTRRFSRILFTIAVGSSAQLAQATDVHWYAGTITVVNNTPSTLYNVVLKAALPKCTRWNGRRHLTLAIATRRNRNTFRF